MKGLQRRCLAEAIGTYWLVFAGTGAIVINDVSEGAVTHVGIAMSFGLVVMAMIYSLGDISGAHLNPAVTLGFAAAGRLPWSTVAPYTIAQTAGGCLASLTLLALFPDHPTLGSTIPSGTAMQSLILEVILTTFLMFVILCVSTGPKEIGIMAGIAVGGTVGLLAMFAGPICGASMNPVRSLAPAVASGNLGSLWIYLLATPLGAIVACGLWRAIQERPIDRPTERGAG